VAMLLLLLMVSMKSREMKVDWSKRSKQAQTELCIKNIILLLLQ
jgi:hypothetical protein